ncbi:helix-turn-helix domain-containing protein [Foetidibacter luteolus]|uniref:helix-turn-helix domain-containing protein n=1 Tax=Foetidibacter luteolus TaxID=2608880 RepID=UPI001A9A24DD|nr:helix-turn-helix transcriptional regulator [Foetidibacter luteolus]
MDDIDIDLKRKIAQRMKDLRISTGKKMSEFAKDSEKDRQSLHRWEKGRGATVYTINKFCREIGITMKDFWNDSLFE